ncbi:type 1 fimbrial protein [Pantoea sp. Acro-805]|uniref:Type 1 fimbrial protein n=1 Tax=Candidatus Pantoea formicae TaxID=2608355 RepID=A0ABX0QXW4_9GAMM|nr:type 1 fimbrial protein [Pantoea formicae]NIF01848.1 type 1 fimbrial protein [Pantoea formicae]
MKKSIIALSMLSLFAVSSVHAKSGKVTFTGSIIDAPCSIAPGSVDQTVSLGAISNVVLAENGNTGSSTPQRFTIELEDCVIATPGTKDKVTTRFTGAPSSYDSDSLALVGGTAGGASIQLFANNGAKVKINTPTAEQQLFNGGNTLSFTANVKGGGSTSTIVPGTFQVPANFVLSYN